MNSFKLALLNVKNNIKLFKFNIVSMMISIAVFVDFFSLIFNPSFNLIGSDHMLINVTMYMASLLLMFFIIFFIVYSNTFFLKQRKREIGIYTFMGVDASKIGMVFAIEQIILGSVALFLGIILGIVFEKAFLMFLNKITGFNNQVEFYLSEIAIIFTIVVFAFVFFIVGIKGYYSISKSKLIKLINFEKREEKPLKSRYITGIISIILLITGYLYSRDVFNELFVFKCTIVMICIIPGVFLFFYSFLSMVISFMVKNKMILYNGTNIISISNIGYRIKYNYKTLAIITIITAATIISASACLTIQHIFTTITEVASPYSFSYMGEADVTNKVLEIINDSKHNVEINVQAKCLKYDATYGKKYSKNHPVLKQSEFINIVNQLPVEDKQEIINEVTNLQEGEAVIVSSLNDSGFDKEVIDMYNIPIKVRPSIDVPLLGSRFEYNTIILKDNDYDKFKEACLQLSTPIEEETFNGIIVSNQDESLELQQRLLADVPELQKNLNSYINYYNSYYAMTGVAKFIGLFLGIVFMLTTGSIMFMKIIGDVIEDKKKYDILLKLGLTQKELKNAVSKQVGLSYILPLIIGGGLAYMGIMALSGFLNKFFTISLLKPYLISVVIYCVVYACFYVLTTRKFVNMVTN